MTKPGSAEDYLAAQPPERRARLEAIRRVIQTTAPEADEALIYSMPGFRLAGQQLAAYAAAKHHDGFYPCSGSVVGQHPEIAERFTTTKGAVHFPLDAPIPEDVVALLVRTRMAALTMG